MKGIMGVQSLMMNTANVKAVSKGKVNATNTPAISFQKFLKQQQGQSINGMSEKKLLSDEEKKLLKNSFVFLTDLKIKLSEQTEVKGSFNPFNKNLKKLLEDMGQDMEFIALLPDHMKEILKNYLQQMNGTYDPKAIEALVSQWNQYQDEKMSPIIGEVDELLNAIKIRLNQSGITVDVQMEDQKKTKITFTQDKEEGKFSVVAKPLLNRISKFLNKTDGIDEKIQLKDETFELRDSLRKYLQRDQQPVGWHKEELIQKAQNATLRRLQAEQGEPTKQMSSLTVEKLIKEEVKDISLVQSVKENEEETATSIKKIDQSVGVMLHTEPDPNQAKSVQVARHGQRFFNLQPENLFSQMVEKFQLQVKDGASQMEIQLHPEELGRIQLSLSIEDGVVTARLLTGNIHVKELIEQNLPQLRETFAKDGLKWDEITVDVNQDHMGGNAFASHGQENLEDQRRGRSRRRGNLGELMDEDFELGEIVGLDEEETKVDLDRLVDYMA